MNTAMEFLHGFNEADLPVLPDEGAGSSSASDGQEDPSAADGPANGTTPPNMIHEHHPVLVSSEGLTAAGNTGNVDTSMTASNWQH
ncbi:uncharacterized protein APUU_80338S [Aspergillus puulaauensis]|uniref:Uncharacterized protein n=1 Tax=Aspergillus puulaauensis TaxID=1220207 RepID=A0A7R7XYG1_9EURO|nr:uncharacterized protein APUU_80338S [Aspergillus puulaauensis]BCS30035.1 hypothetical protein APUU_80338S [Aspergillus puulaauensis]